MAHFFKKKLPTFSFEGTKMHCYGVNKHRYRSTVIQLHPLISLLAEWNKMLCCLLSVTMKKNSIDSTVTRCWNKKWPKFVKSCPKGNHSSFSLKIWFFNLAQKVTKHLSYFCNKINRPIWSHWIRPKDKLNCPRALCLFAISCSTQRGVTFR